MVPNREQHVLFAASGGQAAINDTWRKTGLFSDELFAILLDAGTQWPPDADWLAQRLDSRFTQLRAEGVTRQLPPYLWRRTPSRDGLVYGLTTTVDRPSRLGLPALAAIVDAMLATDELSDVPNLQLLVKMLPAQIRGAVRYTGVPRMDLIQLLGTCQRFREGRDALAMVLRYGMHVQIDRDAVQRVLDEHWPAPTQLDRP